MNLRNELDKAIPKNEIETRNKAGLNLKYLSGAYVIDRMNQVIGHGNWSYKLIDLRNVHEGLIGQKNGEAFTVSYLATIELSATIENKVVTFLDVGYGDGTDKHSKGLAHELASKEAVTDGVKRCAKNLGRSMGLELYFKDGIPVIENQAVINEIKEKFETKVIPKKEIKNVDKIPDEDIKKYDTDETFGYTVPYGEWKGKTLPEIVAKHGREKLENKLIFWKKGNSDRIDTRNLIIQVERFLK